MMASIGSISFITIKGSLFPMAMATEPLERPGVDGVAFREVGLRGAPLNVTTYVDVDDAAPPAPAIPAP